MDQFGKSYIDHSRRPDKKKPYHPNDGDFDPDIHIEMRDPRTPDSRTPPKEEKRRPAGSRKNHTRALSLEGWGVDSVVADQQSAKPSISIWDRTKESPLDQREQKKLEFALGIEDQVETFRRQIAQLQNGGNVGMRNFNRDGGNTLNVKQRLGLVLETITHLIEEENGVGMYDTELYFLTNQITHWVHANMEMLLNDTDEQRAEKVGALLDAIRPTEHFQKISTITQSAIVKILQTAFGEDILAENNLRNPSPWGYKKK